MCGIAGLLDLSGAPASRDVLLRMLRRIEHRGPDGGAWFEDDGSVLSQGTRRSPRPSWTRPSPGVLRATGLKVALGHQRLAITDLSDSGRQPMTRAGGRWWVVFNGAIYNAPELREELRAEGEEFTSSADTEVLLAAYARWGTKALERLNGMWAFAIWDAERRELFCARDRFAIKPFYYTVSGSIFAFASEPKALRPVCPAEPNLQLTQAYLREAATVDGVDATCYASYRCLPPGCGLRLDDKGMRIESWYDLDERVAALEPPKDLSAASKRLRELLEDAVALRLRADVPVGLLLSGGVDSSGIAGILVRCGAGGGFSGRTISSAYPALPDIDETFYVREALGATRFSEDFIEPSSEEFDRDFDQFVTSIDTLVNGSTFYVRWLLNRRAREIGIPVMLGGQGSDELFGGYEPWDVRVVQLWNRGLPAEAVREAFLSGRRQWGALRGLRHTVGVLRTARFPLPCGCAGGGSLQDHQRHLLVRDHLPAVLAYDDRASMAWGIESRLPFLDHRIVEFARSLPDGFLVRSGWTKIVLREALEGIVPRSILRRPTRLGLPGPVESRLASRPLPVRGAWRRLKVEGWVESKLPEDELLTPERRLRIRVLDAWLRCCLGGDSSGAVS